MFRPFNHYRWRQTIRQVVGDLSLSLVVFVGVSLFFLERGAHHGVTTAHGLSLLAGIVFINTASGLYLPPGVRSWTVAILPLGFAVLLTYLVFNSLPGKINGRGEVMLLMMSCVASVVAHRIYSAHGDAAKKPYWRVLVLGAGPAAQLVAQTIGAANPQVKIVGFVPASNESSGYVDAPRVLTDAVSLKDRVLGLDVDEIIVAVSERRSGSMPMRELLDCRCLGVRVSDLSTYFEKMLGQIRIDHLHPGWLIFGNGFNNSTYRDVAKRLFDIASSSVLLLFTAPLMLLTAVCIALESKGPILYRQERVGQDGKRFSVLKFRSMRIDAENQGVPQWAATNDNRVTRVGSTIRRFRVDELPQLFNVLKGEMSLVGPRPERPYFVSQLSADIPFYALRHSVKPGLTGWAQVRYQYGASIEDSLEKLQYDLYYVKNHSLFLDIVVLFETIGVVLSGKGAR
jgi:sugar transferase (PEP-CTERM system associated)